jgi:ADP-ribosylglycohydrolase
VSTRERALGALHGLAVGDALGMPTQYLPRATVAARYGVLDSFHPGPEDNEISRGTPAGRVTDDTDQAVILGRLLVEGGGRLDPHRFAEELLAWQKRMQSAGSQDLLGPSTVRALALVEAGESTDRTGRWGDTNGASMRVTPVGIAFAGDDLLDAVEESCRVTHHTGIAIAGAAAVAAAVSSGVEGRSIQESLEAGIEAAVAGAQRGHYVAGADVAARIRWAIDLVDGVPLEQALDVVYDLVGAGVATQEAVPAAFAVVSLFPDDPWQVCRYAASLGGDCDTIAAMAGAVAGAHHDDGIPAYVLHALHEANPALGLDVLVDDLLALRGAAPQSVHVR